MRDEGWQGTGETCQAGVDNHKDKESFDVTRSVSHLRLGPWDLGEASGCEACARAQCKSQFDGCRVDPRSLTAPATELQRKSLRDQRLMEGAPLSPTSQSPRSPLWGAQENGKHIDKLQSESQQLEEEEVKLKEQMKHGHTEAVEVAENGAEMVVQNGENNAIGSGGYGVDSCHKMHTHTHTRHNILIKLMYGMQTQINLRRILHTLNNKYPKFPFSFFPLVLI
ncbi:uncharacterized protein LOC116692876 [Etheostoma spectabile]|uniref:uncharacterized protein LOC116692876 n=1 Tax=Etheostoma spectabile TaxID=54343 RepID=UPI0013AF42E9|nr:uncharacterized protein LOC116692876 [Etheostoma spectabile]